MALHHCPVCNSTSTQANVNTLNCLSCGCVFDFAGAIVDQPEQGVTTTEDVSWSDSADDDAESDDERGEDAAEKPRKRLSRR